ncbi:hypothetical protein [Roseateles sp.]|uniref:hypothetical protein n=1 Tax=Roseateles sp. TaxID=1971397 RepID=UPI00395E041C
MPINNTVATSNVFLELGGKPTATLRSVTLPGIQVQQVVVPRGPNGEPRLGRDATLTELALTLPLNQADSLGDWLLAVGTGKDPKPADAAVLVADFNFKLQRRIECAETWITQVQLPVLDARDGKAALELDLRCQPARVAYAQLGSNAGKVVAGPSPKAKQLMAGNFRVKGLPFGDASHVVRVALPTLAVELAGSPASVARVDLGEVEITLSRAGVDAALAWVLKAASDGQVSDAEVLSLDIELLDPALKKVLLTVQLGGCVLTRFQEDPLDARKETLGGATLRFAVGRVGMVFA